MTRGDVRDGEDMPRGGWPDESVADIAARRDALRQAAGLPGADLRTLIGRRAHRARRRDRGGRRGTRGRGQARGPARGGAARVRAGGTAAAARGLPVGPGPDVPARAGRDDQACEQPGGGAARGAVRVRDGQDRSPSSSTWRRGPPCRPSSPPRCGPGSRGRRAAGS